MAILRVFNRFVSCPPENVKSQAYVPLVVVVVVWNTPAAYGIHILKSIAKILKEYNGKREPVTVTNLLCPVVRTPVSANPGLNFNPGFFFFLSKALSPDNFLYSF